MNILVTAENIIVKNLEIEQAWDSKMAVNGSLAFNNFQKRVKINMQRTFRHSHSYQRYLYTKIESIKKHTLWENSTIVTLNISFTGLDSSQMLLLQDSLENDNYLGKMKIIYSLQTQYETSLGAFKKNTSTVTHYLTPSRDRKRCFNISYDFLQRHNVLN
eukprot:Seg423.2 transcript_id=Seg423.2/GoldUCD/mRNA.D3Y31 product="hypothetical protein" protein_id=Seg423.2/GoldUCD/D3Y31